MDKVKRIKDKVKTPQSKLQLFYGKKNFSDLWSPSLYPLSFLLYPFNTGNVPAYKALP